MDMQHGRCKREKRKWSWFVEERSRGPEGQFLKSLAWIPKCPRVRADSNRRWSIGEYDDILSDRTCMEAFGYTSIVRADNDNEQQQERFT